MYEYDRLFGYYRLAYGQASLYLYLFSYSAPTRLEFESIKRYGVFYSQFDYLLKAGQRKIVEANRDGDAFNSICLLNKLPFYMLDEMEYKVVFSNTFVPMSINSYEMLMYFYPKLWWVSFKDCTTV
jgi:hypothetical protein